MEIIIPCDKVVQLHIIQIKNLNSVIISFAPTPPENKKGC